ncbi:MAG: hypothetical protein AAF548_00745 [Actinomycetota bacterium]
MKTGGTSFAVHHLGKAFDDRVTFPNDADDGNSYQLDASPYWRLDALRELSQERMSRVELIRAHYPFCAIDLIPHEELVVMTVLRDPVERVISYLKHCQTYHPHHADMSFDEIYDDPGWVDGFGTNHQTKLFSMTADDDPAYCYQPMVVDDARLELAKANLATLDLVGTQERFDEFVAECGRRYGWPTERGGRHRESKPDRPSDDLIERICMDNRIDLDFYDFARSIAC